MDARLIYKFHGKEFIKSPCAEECAGCPKQFTPNPPEDGKTFCRKYIEPAALWKGLNIDGKSKTCLHLAKPEIVREDGKPLNPLKASKRRASQQSRVTVAPAQEVSSKKKNKKKMERMDSR